MNQESLLPSVIQKPWGHERILQKTDKYVVKELYLKPNSRLSLQYHEKKVETMFLVAGSGFLELTKWNRDGSPQPTLTINLLNLSPIFIKPFDKHRLFTRDSDCLIVEVSSIELDDVVRLEDDYGREGQ